MANTKGDIEKLLGSAFIPGAPNWEDRTDSGWAHSAPAEPLVEATPTQAESAPLTWDGPILETPLTLFDKTFDEVLLDEYIERAPSWNRKLSGRFDPFDPDRLRPLVDDSTYSTFIGRSVMTFKDALDHAMQLCFYWAREDEDIAWAKQKEEAAAPVVTTEPDYAEIEAARVEWREACAERDKVVAEANRKVAAARLRYRNARGL